MNIRIKIDGLKAEIEKFKFRRIDINSKIEKFQSDIKISDKKRSELFHLGKFLTQFDDEVVEILELNESPDFIINVNGKVAGLEVVYLLDEKLAEIVKPIGKLFKEAEKLFKKQFPSIKKLVNIYLRHDHLIINQSNRKEIIKDINDCILGLIMNENYEKPEFIRDIYLDPCPHLHFSYNPDINSIQVINELMLKQTILKKEELINSYKENSRLDNIWLLIILGQLTPDSFRVREPIIEIPTTKFDRIYLFEDFELKKHRLK